MISGSFSIIPTIPRTSAPTSAQTSVVAATPVNPDASTDQDQSQIPRVVNRTELVENQTTDQSREQNTQNPSNLSRNAGNLLELDPAEQRVLEQLKARDREVRAHEQAHLSAAGNLATSGASFTYQTGPDGQRYAIGGEVSIDGARVPGDPEATIERAQRIRRAALAPASPSAQDRSVAVNASAIEQKAQAELAAQVREEQGQSAVDAFNSIQINSETESQDEKNKPKTVTPSIDAFI